jgi:hypothetical protein
MTEYTIVGLKEAAAILRALLPYLRLKKDLAIRVIRTPQQVKNPGFILKRQPFPRRDSRINSWIALQFKNT